LGAATTLREVALQDRSKSSSTLKLCCPMSHRGAAVPLPNSRAPGAPSLMADRTSAATAGRSCVRARFSAASTSGSVREGWSKSSTSSRPPENNTKTHPTNISNVLTGRTTTARSTHFHLAMPPTVPSRRGLRMSRRTQIAVSIDRRGAGHARRMRLTLYAADQVHRTRQYLGDFLLVLWVVTWVRLADTVGDATERLAVPGRRIESSGTDLAERLRDAGSAVAETPLVGDELQSPFDGAGSAADGLADAGTAQVEAVHTLAFWLELSVALIPIVLAAAVYLPFRIRFVRRATAGQRFVDSADDLDLFALRALTNQPLHRLARISDDPAGAWRTGDRDVVRRLAELELREVGLKPTVGG
jgi:hypothetical protein